MAGAEERLREALVTRRGLTPFVGSGVSRAATEDTSCAGWEGLLSSGIKYCESTIPILQGRWGDNAREKLKDGDLNDYLAIGGEISSRLKGVGEGRDFDTWIENGVGKLAATEEGELLIKAVRGLGSVILTTNYDTLIEDVLPKWDAYDWKDSGFPSAIMDSQVVLHLHGSARKPRSVVLGGAEYQGLESELNLVLTKSFFLSHRLVFIGCGAGLGDPHIALALKFMSTALKDEEVEHFILVTNAEHSALTEHPISTRIAPVPYGAEHGELRQFLEKLATAREKAATTQPEAGEQEMPVQQRTGLLLDAEAAEQKLTSALTGLNLVTQALQRVESSSAVPPSMADWEIRARIEEHERAATRLRKPAADLDTSAMEVIPLVSDASIRTWQLTPPAYDEQGGELTQITAAISELEKASGQLITRVARLHGDLLSRVRTYSGYRDALDRVSHAHAALSKAHADVTSLRTSLGISRAHQEESSEPAAPPVPPERPTEPPAADGPTSPPSLRLAPMLGQVAGGTPTGTGEADEEQIPVPPQYSRRNDVYAVKVNGDSMKGYGVLGGDYVTVLRDAECKDGDMVVAIFGTQSAAEAVVKVLRISGRGQASLESSDPEETEKLRKLGAFEIQGKVVGLVRWHIEHVPRRTGKTARQPSPGQDAGQATGQATLD